MFWNKKKNTGADSKNLSYCLEQLDESKLPILTSVQLLTLLNQNNRIKSIKQLSGVGAEHYESLYKPMLDCFIECCQLVPASASHHHAGLGGLIIHTLEVIERALKIRKKHELPQNSEPELIAAEEHIWTYAVFIGAILHEAAKLITNYKLELNNEVNWNAYGKRLHKTGAVSYSIAFVNAPYGLHAKLGATFFHMIPNHGRQWIGQNNVLMGQLSSFLQNDHFESGVVGDIVRESDGYSVAQNLKTGGDRNRLVNAPSVPLVDKLMTALRQLLENQEIKVNSSGGSAGWVEGEYTYLVCAVIAEKVISYLRISGSTDVPADNSRIFDILQEHGFVIPNTIGKAIWSVSVVGPKINNRPSYGPYHLTMLKFETNRLFHPSHRPQPFGGTISVNDTETTKQKKKTEAENNCTSIAETDLAENITETDSKSVTETNTPKHDIETIYEYKSETTNLTLDSDPEEDPFAPTKKEDCANNSSKAGNNNDPGTNSKNETSDDNTGTAPKGLMDPNIGKHFLVWVQDSIKRRKLMVNKPKAKVHVVKEGVLLITPLIFKEYIESFDLIEESVDIMDGVKRIQNRLQKLKCHIKAANSMNIHVYKVVGINRESKITGWLFPTDVIYKEIDPPKANSYLTNSSGIKEKKPDE